MAAAIAHFIDYRPDLLINRPVRLLDKTRLFASTHVLVVCDHGGPGGGTAATTSACAGQHRGHRAHRAPRPRPDPPLPSAWTGRVVTEAFA